MLPPPFLCPATTHQSAQLVLKPPPTNAISSSPAAVLVNPAPLTCHRRSTMLASPSALVLSVPVAASPNHAAESLLPPPPLCPRCAQSTTPSLLYDRALSRPHHHDLLPSSQAQTD
ncbi:hypothetical protein M0R45_035612 [Rubus argutus]|uniref:Uncharacterized protein n=1 Tax=Rubus argutus TaxID=59490 RepID=A0AAW1VUJ0_RUBAR